MHLWSPAFPREARSRSRAGHTSSGRHATRGAPATTRRAHPQSALPRPSALLALLDVARYAFEAPPSGPRGGTPTIRRSVLGHEFQSAPPRGRRRARRLRLLRPDIVSIRASTREATPEAVRLVNEEEGFNPRLHAGGDAYVVIGGIGQYVFQSAPPRGRRPARSSLRGSGHYVSIRASTREATCPFLSTRERSLCFNPRLHAGGDLARHGAADAVRQVSIRAYTREATGSTTARLPRSRFQSAPPRGRRLSGDCAGRASSRFNPRLHAGGDTRSAWILSRQA